MRRDLRVLRACRPLLSAWLVMKLT
eukprot:COSAG06_NODE_48727_length_330_cov_0.662338_1_plen_24_part_10